MPGRLSASRTVVASFVAALALSAAGCGGQTQASGDSPANRESGGTVIGGGGGGRELAASDAADVLNARRTINALCRSGTRATATAELSKPVSTFVRILRVEGGDKIYEVGSGDRAQELKVVARDLVQQLGSCGATDQAQRIQRVSS